MANGSQYEVVMTNGMENYLVGFAARKSRVGLRNTILGTAAGKSIAANFIASDDDVISFGVREITFPGWTVKFSGYTANDGGRPSRLALPAVA